MTETIKRIISLMEENGINAHTLEKNANLPLSSITAWKKERFKPSVDSITNLARYFNVSADYLLCLIDEPKPLQQSDEEKHAVALLSTELAELSQDQQFTDSVKLYKAMPTEFRKEICIYILGAAAGLGLNIQKILGR